MGYAFGCGLLILIGQIRDGMVDNFGTGRFEAVVWFVIIKDN
jgi:hypothetical protein